MSDVIDDALDARASNENHDPIDQALSTRAQNIAQPTAATSTVLGNIGAGALSAATSIGSTLLWPFDKALHAINPSMPSPAERRQALIDFYASHADPNSLAFKGGQLGGMIAGTAGVGGALGAGAEAMGAAPEIVSALSSGGMSLGGQTTGSALGNAALRASAGAVVGGASAGLIEPKNAPVGAAIGAATPGVAWLMGMAGKGIGKAIGYGARNLFGATTGTGANAVDAAYQAGLNGDRSFIDNMRGDTDFADVVQQAKDALGVMREARGSAYRAGMASVSADKTVLDMTPITAAVQSAKEQFATYNGEIVNENANNALSKIEEKVANWSTKDPTTFHTPEGLDKLKQWIGGELENTKPGTQTDAAVKGIYNAVKSTIAAQAPDYANTMQAYQDASEQLNEISRTLSLNPKASVDTSIRKLQSILRNNVTTNFGNRASAVETLENQGGANLRSALAGQSMSSVWPRGIAGAIDAAAAIPAALHNPLLLAGGLAASPRLVGEAAYGAGRAFGSVPSVTAGEVPLSSILPVLNSQKSSLAELINYRNDDRNPATNP